MAAGPPAGETTEAELKRLREEVQLLRQMVETVPAVVLRLSVTGTIEYVNKVLPEFAHVPVVGMDIYSFAPADQHTVMRAAIAKVTTTQGPGSYESIAVDPEGRREWWITTLNPLLRGDRLVGILLATTQATRVKEAEAALVASRAELKMALAAGNVGVWSWDKASDAVRWDDTLTEMYGLRPEEAPRTVAQYLAVIPENQRAAMAAHIERALETGHYPDFPLTVGPRSFIIKGGIQRDLAGNVSGLMGGVIDVTDRRQLEERLQQAQKLEAVGQLAAGVAHNFNNMLAVIIPSLELVRKQVEDQSLLEDAITSATNAAQLVRELMVFSRSGSQHDFRRETLSEAVRRAVELCRKTFPPSVRLELGALDAGRDCAVNAGALEQALVNLLFNARDAITRDAGGAGTIELTLQRRPNAEVRRLHPQASGDFVELRVRDEGHGMDAATRARMLEPFFSTKPVGRGTGLGLSTAWGTVHGHGGFLDCQSEPGAGTTFTLLIPATAVKAPHSAPAALLPRASEGRVVLLIDDDAAVRRATGALLSALGFSVLMATGGDEGLRIAAGTPVDVVLLDYSMPGRSAELTLAALHAHQPALPVICLSGLDVTLEGAAAHLLKPVTHQVLVEALQRVLPRSR
ncbi:MAG: ATP-binding protein [Archangium sp.]|nr:ATP-binding protein [Archangium sp.]MDP3574531.1 ATP-binding protein [Archangium sp.]